MFLSHILPAKRGTQREREEKKAKLKKKKRERKEREREEDDDEDEEVVSSSREGGKSEVLKRSILVWLINMEKEEEGDYSLPFD